MKNFNFYSEKDRNSFYCSKEWRELREFLLSQNPICIKCFIEGKIVPATEIDHIVDLKIAPQERFNTQNLQCLCKSCHSEKTYNDNLRKSKLWKIAKPLWKIK